MRLSSFIKTSIHHHLVTSHTMYTKVVCNIDTWTQTKCIYYSIVSYDMHVLLLLLVRLHDQSSSSDEVGGLLQVLQAPWHVTTLVSFIYTWSLLPTKLYWSLYSDSSTPYLIRALIQYHSHLLLLLNHVVIVAKLCCVEGLMEDRCTFNKHSR